MSESTENNTTEEITGQKVVPSSEPKLTSEPKPTDSYVKLAMRNMVRKKGQSLKHFTLTMIGLFTILIGLSYLTKP